MSNQIIFSQRLRNIRNIRKLRQSDVSELSGVPMGTLVHLETDRKPSYENIIKLARFFNVPSDYLIGLIDTPYRPQASPLEKQLATMTYQQRKHLTLTIGLLK